LYFEDDPAKEVDWREWIANVSLGAKVKDLELKLVDSGMYHGVPLKTAKFDFTLVKDKEGLSYFDQWNWYCLHESPQPIWFFVILQCMRSLSNIFRWCLLRLC